MSNTIGVFQFVLIQISFAQKLDKKNVEEK